jgi:DNA-binding FadR family transcriptional regulator
MTSKDKACWQGPARVHHRVARGVAEAILAGRHLPGEFLPGEIEGSEQLGVSRTAYREAMRILIAKGLIESRPRAGSRVCQKHRWNVLDPDVLAWMSADAPSEPFIRDLFELRSVIEPAAAAMAAERRDDNDIAVMRRALDDMERWTLRDPRGREADSVFHNAVLAATRNDAMIALSSSVGAAVTWTTALKQRGQGLLGTSLPEHRRVHDAIVAADPDAARRAMVELVSRAFSHMGLSQPACCSTKPVD